MTCFIRCSTLQPQPMLAHSQLGGWGVVTLASDPRLPVLPWQSSPVVAVSPLSVVRAWPGPSSFPVQVASQFIHLHPAVESRRVFRLIKVSPSASRFAPSFPGFPSHGSRPFLSFSTKPPTLSFVLSHCQSPASTDVTDTQLQRAVVSPLCRFLSFSNSHHSFCVFDRRQQSLPLPLVRSFNVDFQPSACIWEYAFHSDPRETCWQTIALCWFPFLVRTATKKPLL